MNSNKANVPAILTSSALTMVILLAHSTETLAAGPVPPPFPGADSGAPASEPREVEARAAPTTDFGLFLKPLGGWMKSLGETGSTGVAWGGEVGIRLGSAFIGAAFLSLPEASIDYALLAQTTKATFLGVSVTGGSDSIYFGARLGSTASTTTIEYPDGISELPAETSTFTAAPLIGLRLPLGGGSVREMLSLEVEAAVPIGISGETNPSLQALTGFRVRF